MKPRSWIGLSAVACGVAGLSALGTLGSSSNIAVSGVGFVAGIVFGGLAVLLGLRWLWAEPDDPGLVAGRMAEIVVAVVLLIGLALWAMWSLLRSR